MSATRTIRAMLAAAPLLLAATVASAQEVNVYSSRHYAEDKAIFAAFEKETGIKVNVVQGKANALFERLKREGQNSPADLLITVDAGNLGRAQAAGLFQPMNSDVAKKAVPANLREPSGLWTGLTKRARVIMYHKDRVKPSQLSTYEAIADEKWRGKLLIRSSNNIYNQSLVASLIASNGEAETLEWAKGVVANMARSPKGGDTDQLRALGAGEGDIAVSNTYYLGRLSASKASKDRDLVAKLGVFFPNQEGRGAHVNISGVGVTRHARNKDSAVKLIEYLLSRKSQQVFASANFEYPVRTDVEPHPILAAWGDFKADDLAASVIAEKNADAVRLMDKAGWR